MGDDPYEGIEMDDLLANLPDPTPQVFTNVDVWQAISQYMNPLMAERDTALNREVARQNIIVNRMEAEAEQEYEDGMPMELYMSMLNSINFRKEQRDLVLNRVRQLHESMMFIRRLAGMRGRELYRQHRN
jgi:hypothetical protein